MSRLIFVFCKGQTPPSLCDTSPNFGEERGVFNPKPYIAMYQQLSSPKLGEVPEGRRGLLI